jgi:NADPH:quinone reductase-like Zn-dependent oxidoreductase
MLQVAILGSLLSTTGSTSMGLLMHRPNHQDLETLSAMVAAGTIAPIIDRCYQLQETADAIRALGAGQIQGKLVIGIGAGASR